MHSPTLLAVGQTGLHTDAAAAAAPMIIAAGERTPTIEEVVSGPKCAFRLMGFFLLQSL